MESRDRSELEAVAVGHAELVIELVRLFLEYGMVQKAVRHRCAQHPAGRSGNGA